MLIPLQLAHIHLTLNAPSYILISRAPFTAQKTSKLLADWLLLDYFYIDYRNPDLTQELVTHVIGFPKDLDSLRDWSEKFSLLYLACGTSQNLEQYISWRSKTSDSDSHLTPP